MHVLLDISRTLFSGPHPKRGQSTVGAPRYTSLPKKTIKAGRVCLHSGSLCVCIPGQRFFYPNMAQLQPASIALDGGDPRLNNVGEGVRTYTTTEYKGIHDPSVSFEEYLHYAKISRLDEKHFVDGPGTALTAIIGLRKKEGSNPVVHTIDEKQSADEKEKSDSPVQGQSALAVVSDEEWRVAGRAARTATWGAIFYLYEQ